LKSELEDLISQGRYFEARSNAEETLENSSSPRIKQLHALAVSKLGMPELALESMEAVYRQSPEDPESAGILGSIYKELFKKNQKTSFAIQSRDTYQKNFAVTQNYYTGINAASMSAMAGQVSKAREIAAQVIALIEKLTLGFWEHASLGEAYLLIKNKPKSVENYLLARKMAGNDWGKVTSVHNQLWLLNHYIPVPNEVMKLFAPPNVVAFAGHMIDNPSRTTPRFPAAIEHQVKESIRHSIRTLNARIGYCSLACGSDILFVETMIEEGGEVNLFLPFAQEDFIKTSLAFAGQQWVTRFYNLVDNYPINFVTTSRYGGHDELFTFLSRIIYGAAILRSHGTHSEPNLLTVLSDQDLKSKEGGTRDTINRWPFPQRHININPDIFTINISVPSHAAASPISFEKTNGKILYFIHVQLEGPAQAEFRDMVNEHKNEMQDDAFKIVADETTGDSTILAFNSDAAAMEFLSTVKEKLKTFKQANHMKVVLHAGMVSFGSEAGATTQKMIGKPIGDLHDIAIHVGAGTVCASECFAAILALNSRAYLLNYAGVITSKDKTESWPFYLVE
jgi:tetratricopeptide (TPR) repeat protein